MKLERPRESEPRRNEFMAFDFVGGILHRQAQRTGGKFAFQSNDTQVHTAFKAAFDYLMERAADQQVEVVFRIYPDQFHGDSQTLREEFTFLSSLSVLKGYNGSYATLIYDGDNPFTELFEKSPYASADLMDEAAVVFAEHYVT